MTWRIFTCLSLLLFSATLAHADSLAKVVPLEVKNSAEVKDPILKKILEHYDLHPSDINANPEIKSFVKKAAAMLQELILPKDGNAPIHFVLVDDASVNAAFVKSKVSGTRAVILNLGMVRFVRNDDELAHFLSHELEHATALLQDQADTADNLIDRTLFQRAVENEVDAKAATQRLLKRGYNPYASVDILERMDRHMSSLGSNSHTNTASRKHTTGLALVYESRELGADNPFRLNPEARRTEVTGSIKKNFLNHPSYISWQKSRLKALLSKPDTSGIEEAYRKVLGTGGNPLDFENFYAEKFAKVYSAAERMGAGDLPIQELIDFQLRLHQSLSEAFQRIRASVLGPNYIATTLEKMKLLQAIDHREYRVSAPDIFNAAHELKYAKMALENEQKLLDAAADPGLRSSHLEMVNLYRKMYERAEKNFQVSKLPYLDNGKLDEKIGALLQAGRTGSSLGRFPEHLPELGIQVKTLGPTILATAQQNTQTLADHAPLVFAQPASVHQMPEQLDHLYALKKSGPALHSFFDRLMAQIKITLKDQSQHERGNFLYALFDTWWNQGSERGNSLAGAYLDLSRLDPLKAKHFLREIVTIAGESIPDASQLNGFLQALKKSGVPVSGIQDPAVMQALVKAAQRVRKNGIAGAADLAGVSKEINSGILLDAALSELGGKPVSPPGKEFWESAAEKVRAFYPAAIPAQAETIAFVKFPQLRQAAGEGFGSLPKRLKELAGSQIPPTRIFTLSELTPLLDGKPAHPEAYSSLAAIKDWLAMASNKARTGDTDVTEFLRGMAEWLLKNRREELGAGKPFERIFAEVANELARDPTAGDLLSDYFSDRYRRILSRNVGLPSARRFEQSIYEFYKESSPFLRLGQNANYYPFMISAWRESSGQTPINFLQQMRRGTKRYLREIDFPEGHPERLDGEHRQLLTRIDSAAEKEIFENLRVSEKDNPEDLFDLFRNRIKENGKSLQSDRWFDLLWERYREDPRYAPFFTDPELVGKMHYEDRQLRLAKWQLDREFQISEKSKALRVANKQFPLRQSMRAEIPAISDSIEKRMPDFSGVRNELVTHVQNALLSTEAETEILGKLRLNGANWQESKSIQAIDLPQTIAKTLDGGDEQMKLLRYLIGQDQAVPQFHSLKGQDAVTTLTEARRLFQSSDVNLRTYALLPLVDESTGLLAQPENSEKLFRLVLGDHYDNPLTARIFRTYLKKLPASERTAVMARILGGMGGQEAEKATLKTILEAMGPFGIKVGQFLRTTGALPFEQRKQLDNFFDAARPVDRDQVMARMREVFGKNLVHVDGVGQMVGSGSVNYAVLADIKDPETGKPRRVVVRFLRDAVEGQVRNENEIWQEVISELKQDIDPYVRRTGRLLDEARSHAYSNLSTGGSELDLERGRESFPAMQKTYYRAAKGPGKLTLEVAPPVAPVQKLVDEKFQSMVSVQEYVPNIRFPEIPMTTRRNVAAAIAEAELRALMKNGTFDPDGHPGNWLYDEGRNRLVRIDYDQDKHLASEELKSVRRVFTALVSPGVNDAMVSSLVSELGSVFQITGEIPGGKGSLAKIFTKALRDPALPPFSLPHERLFFLEEKLQRELIELNPAIEVKLRPNIQSALASLGRIAIYRETIGDRAFGSLLLKSLDINPLAHGMKQLSHTVKNSVSRILSTTDCNGWFSRLKP